MTRKLQYLCLSMALSTALAQAGSAQNQNQFRNRVGAVATNNQSPVAYVYVSSRPANAGANEVVAWAAAQNGTLTPVTGSPFQENINSLALNGKYLFGTDGNGIDIDAYTIEQNGALAYATQTSVVQGQNCDAPVTIFLDHTGQSLYNVDLYGNDCANSTYQSFAVNSNTGGLTFLNYAGASPEYNGVLKFIGNNQFAYASSCYHFNPLVYGVQRASNGALTLLSGTQPFPTAPSGEGWCPNGAAADPTNHVAVPMYPATGPGDQGGPYQLAVYTANASGNLTTTSTYQNMPSVAVGSVTDISSSPSGELVAVAGTGGLQVFHFNGANPITKYTGLLTNVEVDHIYWDSANHLYGISYSGQKLFVFTVTPTAYSQASGSPYAVSTPQNLIVQPLPLP